MSSSAETSRFEAQRDHLTGVAYRMLGSRGDAEDAVQEAWLRYRSADHDEIHDVRAWLTTVTARICLDQLRSARMRREAYVGQWLPEPVVERLPADRSDPAEMVTRADEVSYALLIVLERLSPEQRVAFVLHDVFAVAFDEIAGVLSTTPTAARKLASRARQAVRAQDAPRHAADLAEQHRVVTAFLAAARSGDIDGLLAVLAPDVVALGDGGGAAPSAPQPIRGAGKVARFLTALLANYQRRAERIDLEPMLINGDLGVVAEVLLPGGKTLRTTMTFAVAGGRITGVFNQLNPDKLVRVPAPLPGWWPPPPD